MTTHDAHAAHIARRQAAATKLTSEITGADLTAAAVTRAARAITAQTPMTTVTIAPGAFRTRLKYEGTGDNAHRLLREVSAWFIQHGYDASVARKVSPRSHGTDAWMLTVIDSPRREREATEMAARREEALRTAMAENPAATPAELATPGREPRRGPSPEAVRRALAQFQKELTAMAPAIARVLEEDDTEAAAPCPRCRYFTGHTSWCPLRG